MQTGIYQAVNFENFFEKLLTPTQRNSLRYVYREEEMTMMTVNEVSKLTGVSIRTLQYYDTIGLLKPIEYTESGYRLYDDTSLERLQQILLFKELEFPLKEIKKIIDAPNFDRNKALEQQIELLTMKKEHLENLISFARGIKGIGVKYMDFKVFDTTKIDEYSKRAKEQWGQTSEYKEFEEKTKNWTKDDEATVANEFMQLFVVTAIPKSIIAIPNKSILIFFIANTFVTNLNLPSAHIKYINSFTCKLCCANSSNIINIFRKFSSTGIHSSKTA